MQAKAVKPWKAGLKKFKARDEKAFWRYHHRAFRVVLSRMGYRLNV